MIGQTKSLAPCLTYDGTVLNLTLDAIQVNTLVMASANASVYHGGLGWQKVYKTLHRATNFHSTFILFCLGR
jgi:hypothetical protein